MPWVFESFDLRPAGVERRHPDYFGKVLRSVWQDYRGNTLNDADALRVVIQAAVTAATKPGPRKVSVRVVDVFGFESEVVVTLNNA
jgi:adenine-specific DNA-methyltransferase